MKFDIIALSETGLCRQSNQDAVLAVNTEVAGLFAVADGMGGHYKGELASQSVVSLLEKWWQEIEGCIVSMPFSEVVSILEKKIREINKNIYQMYSEMEQLGGTTLCLLLIQKNAYAVLNVGDSRLYRCQEWTSVLMTIDDVWVNVQGCFDCDSLTQAVGAQEELSMNIHTGIIRKKAYFFLCSDGIYKYCGDQYLFSKIRSLMWKKSITVAKQIRKQVYQNGAKDNLSMIIVAAKSEKN